MPHKRAKASVRKANSLSIGSDLPPSQQATKTKKRKRDGTAADGNPSDPTNKIPKNMFRILNAEKIRAEFRMKKQQRNQGAGSSTPSGPLKESKVEPSGSNTVKSKPRAKANSKVGEKLTILPEENLGSFNRRVEAALRPKVTAVMKAARQKATAKNVAPPSSAKESRNDQESKLPQSSSQKRTERVAEFAPRPTKFPLSDVVMEPPTLTLTKPMKKIAGKKNGAPLPISGAQKRMLEDEREKVIKRYRQIKEDKHAQVGS